jgi:riboflavin transporter FmnP
MKNTKRIDVKRITAAAMFAALAYAIHFVHIPVMFLNLDFKDVVVAICGMYFGPLTGLAVAVVVPVIETVTVGGTGIYGMIMNILSSATFVGTASTIYRFRKTLSGAIAGLCAAVFAMTAVMIAANLLITPYYMGVSVAEVGALIPKLLLPFNAIKATLNASLTLCLYKPLTAVLKRAGFGKGSAGTSLDDQAPSHVNKRHSILIWIVCGAITVASLCVIFFVLGGTLAIN